MADEFRDNISEYLSPPWIHDVYFASLEKRASDSGQWVFADRRFVDWQASRNSILWMHGIPGCGKTILSATIIHHLQTSLETGTALAFYFFRYPYWRINNVDGFLSSVLDQLWILLPTDAIPSKILRDFREGRPRPSTEDLFLSLVETLSQFKEVYIVVDALDECILDDRPKFLRFLARLQDLSDSNLHLLVTSRRNLDMQEAMSTLFPLEIPIDAEPIVNDIEIYIKRALETDGRLSFFDETFKSHITETLVHKSERMFLLARLYVSQVGCCRTQKEAMEVLEYMPRVFRSVYTNIVNDIIKKNKPLAINALQWLVFSVEPLSINSLAEAVAGGPQISAFSDEHNPISPHGIVDILQDLVSISHSSNLRGDYVKAEIVHQFLAEFLQHKSLLQEEKAHRLIAESCLQYIAYYAQSDQRTNSKADIARFPILLYACKHWITHARKWAELTDGEPPRELEEDNLENRIRRFLSNELLMQTWLSTFDPDNPAGDLFVPWRSETRPLFYAVRTGIPSVVSDFLQQGAAIDAKNAYSRQPLHIAVEYKAKTIAAILLSHGANPIAKDREGRTPLLEAASSGHVDLTTLLYKHTDINCICEMDDSGSTILHSLAMKAPGLIFKMLMDPDTSRQGKHNVNQQFDINHRDKAGCTLLHRAVEAGNISTIDVLLSKGADLNASDEKQNTPLHFAVRYDQEVAKETLIDHGAVLTIRNAEKKTPLELSWAKKSLRWDLYQIDEIQTRSKRISVGAQAECHVLKKESNCSGPDFIFRKTYNLSRMRSDELYYVRKALLRENQILQRLEHPFIVSYLGYEELESGEARLYLEYCEGGDLQATHVKPFLPAQEEISDDEEDLIISILSNSKLSQLSSDSDLVKPLKEADVWTILYQLFAALAYLHYGVSISRGGACRFEHHWDPVVHRDIKPHNVVLTTYPNGGLIAKLCDLGIARPFVNVNQSRAADRGSQDYSPPEVSDPNIEEKDRKWTSKGDVYSLGKTIDRLYKDFTLSGPLKDILKSCQQPNPNLRPSSLDVLEAVHRHVRDPFQSLENELGYKPGGFILQAFLRIAKNLDITTFGTQTSIMQRKKLVARLDLLLKDGAEASFQEHSRSLHLAILLGKTRMLKDLLLSKGQNPDETWQNSGWTPLHLAAQQGNIEMTQTLLEANASPTTLDRLGYKAVDYARKIDHQDIVKLLHEYSNSKTKVELIRRSSIVEVENDIIELRRKTRAPFLRAIMATLTRFSDV